MNHRARTWGSSNSMNIMRGPSATQTDLGIFKNFRFSSDMGVQFRAEFFNVFNNVNLSDPNTDVSSGNLDASRASAACSVSRGLSGSG